MIRLILTNVDLTNIVLGWIFIIFRRKWNL